MSAPLYNNGSVPFPTGLPNPSYSSQVKKQPRVLVASFGDGYSQRSADGINNNRQIWTNVWENMLLSEYTNLCNFLDSMAGIGAFTWSPPQDPAAGTYKFTCKDYGWTPTDAGAG